MSRSNTLQRGGMTSVMRTLLALTLLTIGCRSREVSPPRIKLLLHEDGVENAYPRLTADGREILYQSNRGGSWQINLLDLATGASRALTSGANNNLPDISPDGTRIAFVSDRDGDEEVYIMNRDGSEPRRLTQRPGRDLHPYFSPDGTLLLYNAQVSGSFDVFALDLATGIEKRLTMTPENETCARVAADGRIVLLRNDARSDDVWVVGVDGHERNLTATPTVRDGWPTWSPDGRWVYFAGMDSGSFSLYRVRADGTGRERLTIAGADEEDARPHVSGDGTRLIFNRRHPGYIDILELSPLS